MYELYATTKDNFSAGRELQLLIEMLIRLCLMLEGLVLLYRNFLF